nr:GNAT family N-acetyltransferase [uncultured Caproiciproducens sp.]
MCRLMKLNPAMEQEYHDYMAEWLQSGEVIVPIASYSDNKDFLDYLRLQKEWETEEGCPEHFVPGTTWFYVNEKGRILGAVNLRHRLNEYLLSLGGHIGYGVRPSERRKGYASKMLSLALGKAKELGLHKVLITCDKDNCGSARTIQKNHGILENEVQDEDRITQRYWINLNDIF